MESAGTIDLHLHTLLSEGALTLDNQFAYAKGRGLTTIAVADRDVLPETGEAARLSGEFGVDFIPGIELTAGYCGEEVHILGYHIDVASPGLRKKVDIIQEARRAHVQIMVYKLNQQGIHLQLDEVKRQAVRSPYIGRYHIARALVERGYVTTMRDAFSDKLIGIDGDCYFPSSLVPAAEIIGLIDEAGGIPVLAHPGVYRRRTGVSVEEVEELRDAGLKGIEVHHPCHAISTAEKYECMARSLNLLITGGSGCRGVNYDPVMRNRVVVPGECLRGLSSPQRAGFRQAVD